MLLFLRFTSSLNPWVQDPDNQPPHARSKASLDKKTQTCRPEVSALLHAPLCANCHIGHTISNYSGIIEPMTTLVQWIRRMNKRRCLKLGLEILLILAVLFAVRTFQQRSLVHGDAPPLSGKLLSGQAITLDDYRGKPVLVHFWATWCSICKMEEDGIAVISKDHAVITVAMNSGNKQTLQAYLDTQEISFPVIVDEHGILAQRFGVRGVPTSFVISPQGKIAFTEAGYTTSWGLRLRLLLAE